MFLQWEDTLEKGTAGYPFQCSGLEDSMMCSPWGCKELDMTEQLSLTHSMPVKPYFCLFFWSLYPLPHPSVYVYV